MASPAVLDDASSIGLPYFDLLLEARAQDEVAASTYDRYVHWGYWQDPAHAPTDPDAFASAMVVMDREITAAAALAPGHSVLDVGCGFGGTLSSIELNLPDVRLVGVNIDPRQLAIAQTRVPTAGFVRANGCHLPFADASFDRVLAVESIFHFPSRLRFLREVARVLKAGGRLALSDFVPRLLWLSRLPPARAIERHIRTGYGPVGNDWSDGDYAAIARRAGLRIVVDRNVTAQTLPTYRAMRELFKRRPDEPAIRRMVSPTVLLQWISRLGLLQYRILAFENAPCHA